MDFYRCLRYMKQVTVHMIAASIPCIESCNMPISGFNIAIIPCFCRYYADAHQPKVAEPEIEEPIKKAPVQLDPEQLLKEAEEQAEEAGNDQVNSQEEPSFCTTLVLFGNTRPVLLEIISMRGL